MPQLFEVFPHLETGMLVIKKMSEDDVCNATVYIPLSWFFFSALIFLKLSGSISRNQKPFNLAEKFSPFSFFLFAVHMPFLLACVQNLWLRFLPMKNPVFCLLEYFGANIVIVALGTFAGVILRKICPMLFGILNGGRG